VTIGERVGRYKGMPARRQFQVHVIRPGVSTSDHLDAAADRTVTYEGKAVAIKI
jgi:alpha-D-xyloside xylohydrolase